MAVNTLFYANEPLFNLFLRRYVEKHGDLFQGKRVMPELGLAFVFSLKGAPTVELAAQKNGSNNVALRFDQMELAIYTYQDDTQDGRKGTFPIQLLVTGRLTLTGHNLTLTGLQATGEGLLNEKAASMANRNLIPLLEQAIKIPLPDFTEVVDQSVRLLNLEIGNHQAKVSAQIGQAGGIPDFPMSNPTFPAIIGAIGGGVINELAAKLFTGAHARVAKRGGNNVLGYAGEAEAGADPPAISIDHSQGLGTIHVWARAKGGIKTLRQWVEPSIKVSTCTPPVNWNLIDDNSGQFIIVKVYLNGKVAFDFDLPGPLEMVADSILSIIRPLADKITAAINQALGKFDIKAFTLPSTLPGADLPAKLSFEQVGFRGNAVVVVIRVE